MKKKMIVLLAGMLVLTAGCGSSSATYKSDVSFAAAESYDSYDSYEYYEDAAYEEYGMEANGASESYDSRENVAGGTEYGQKLIKNFNYSFETLDFDGSMDYLKKSVKEYGGYIESSEVDGRITSRTAYMNLRIPAEKVEEFLSETGSIGEVISRSESAQDISLEYYDTQARLETLRTQRERLMELLEQAATLEDIIELENQLSNVEYEINSYTTRVKVYDNQVNYATIHMTIREVVQIQVVEEDSVWTRIQKGLSENTMHVIDGFIELLIGIVIGIPYIVVWAVFIAIIVLIVRMVIKMNKKNKEKKIQKWMEQNQPSEPVQQAQPSEPEVQTAPIVNEKETN